MSSPYFHVSGLNTEIYGPEITPYFDTFYAVVVKRFLNIVQRVKLLQKESILQIQCMSFNFVKLEKFPVHCLV